MLKQQAEDVLKVDDVDESEHYLVLDTPMQNLKLLINTTDAATVLNELERASWQSPGLQYTTGRLN